MESKDAMQSPIDVRLVDSDDELLELVVRLREEVGKNGGATAYFADTSQVDSGQLKPFT